jgi:hypothetical protein
MENNEEIGKTAMRKSISILKKLWDTKIIPNKCQNERYLHHYYSKEIQEFFGINFSNLENSMLHSEWPTSKKSTNISYSKYRKNDEKKYIIDTDDGSSGFIDFAIGNYIKPEFAIEFTSKYGFSSEDIIFDFLKLLDLKNPFEYVISFNLIYRENDLPQGNNENNVIEALKKTLIEIKNRSLKFEVNRQYLFWIIEIDQSGNKRSWICEDIECGFKKELPDFQKYRIS